MKRDVEKVKAVASPEVEAAMKSMKLVFGVKRHIQIAVQYKKVISLIQGKRKKEDVTRAERFLLQLIQEDKGLSTIS